MERFFNTSYIAKYIFGHILVKIAVRLSKMQKTK